GQRRLLGFAVRPEGWALETAAPAFALASAWEEVFPDLTEEPPADAWRQAWLTWCQPRDLPPAETAACAVEHHGHQLRVRAPRRLVERLRAARSDAVKGEAWLLTGKERVQTAAQVELAEAPV